MICLFVDESGLFLQILKCFTVDLHCLAVWDMILTVQSEYKLYVSIKNMLGFLFLFESF